MENLQAEATEVMSEELLDKYDYEENPKKGDVVKGTVISVNDDAAYVSIGTKAEAILPKRKWLYRHRKKLVILSKSVMN